MKTNVKMLILVFVVLAVGVIYVIPYFNPVESGVGQFSTTSQPGQKLKIAVEKSQPVFLEFYAVT